MSKKHDLIIDDFQSIKMGCDFAKMHEDEKCAFLRNYRFRGEPLTKSYMILIGDGLFESITEEAIAELDYICKDIVTKVNLTL